MFEKVALIDITNLGTAYYTLATNEKYPVPKRDSLTIPIQLQLSQKQKTFSQFSAAFLKSRLNFEHFEKKYEPHWFCISEFTESVNVVI